MVNVCVAIASDDAMKSDQLLGVRCEPEADASSVNRDPVGPVIFAPQAAAPEPDQRKPIPATDGHESWAFYIVVQRATDRAPGWF